MVSAPAFSIGARCSRSRASSSGEDTSPASMRSTRPGQGWFTSVSPAAKRSTASMNMRPASVPGVAITPTTRDRVCSAAGFTAGSMPTKGTSGCCARRSFSAAAEAVLHATTTALQPRARSSAVIPSACRRTSSAGRGP
jgi:hypothetical protein